MTPNSRREEDQHHRELDRRVLDFISAFITVHSYSPSLSEIETGLRIPRSGVIYHLGRLEGSGRIWRAGGKARAIVVLEPTI